MSYPGTSWKVGKGNIFPSMGTLCPPPSRREEPATSYCVKELLMHHGYLRYLARSKYWFKTKGKSYPVRLYRWWKLCEEGKHNSFLKLGHTKSTLISNGKQIANCLLVTVMWWRPEWRLSPVLPAETWNQKPWSPPWRMPAGMERWLSR